MSLLLKNAETNKILPCPTAKVNWLFLLSALLFGLISSATLTYYRKNYKLCIVFVVIYFLFLYSLYFLLINNYHMVINILNGLNVIGSMIFIMFYNKWYFNSLIKNNYKIIYKAENYTLPIEYQQYVASEDVNYEELQKYQKDYKIKRFFITFIFAIIFLVMASSIGLKNKQKFEDFTKNITQQELSKEKSQENSNNTVTKQP